MAEKIGAVEDPVRLYPKGRPGISVNPGEVYDTNDDAVAKAVEMYPWAFRDPEPDEKANSRGARNK